MRATLLMLGIAAAVTGCGAPQDVNGADDTGEVSEGLTALASRYGCSGGYYLYTSSGGKTVQQDGGLVQTFTFTGIDAYGWWHYAAPCTPDFVYCNYSSPLSHLVLSPQLVSGASSGLDTWSYVESGATHKETDTCKKF